MIGVSAITFQIIGNDLPVNHAVLLTGLLCGIAYAIFYDI